MCSSNGSSSNSDTLPTIPTPLRADLLISTAMPMPRIRRSNNLPFLPIMVCISSLTGRARVISKRRISDDDWSCPTSCAFATTTVEEETEA